MGDIASNVDPVYAGLPWAGIRLLLEVSIVDLVEAATHTAQMEMDFRLTAPQAAISEYSQMSALLLGLETALYLSNRLQVYMAYLTTVPASPARNTTV